VADRAKESGNGNGGLAEARSGSPRAGEVTRILRLFRDNVASAAEQLLPLVYEELRSVAWLLMQNERKEHTLQATGLVHEAWIRLTAGSQPDYLDRTHFLAVAAKAMRRILVDHARAKGAAKRGGGLRRITLNEEKIPAKLPVQNDVDVLALHEALEDLASSSERKARVVELRYFGGLTIDETSEVLGVGTTTVEDDWHFARAWLRRKLGVGSGRA
jgi:RNA polymerase sigma-70 factor (ECF subfamily)